MQPAFSLQKRGALLLATDSAHPNGVPVQLAYARPLSNRDHGISVLDLDTKSELFWLETIDDLAPDSKEIAEQALADRYRIATIRSVTDSHVNHGHRYLKVETDKGSRYFNLKEPGKNVTLVTADQLVIRDSMGNRYEIPSLQALDSESRERLDRVL